MTDEWLLTEPQKMRVEPEQPPNLEFTTRERFRYAPVSTLWDVLNAARTKPAIVEKTPIVTVFLLEGANVGQLWRMWTSYTAAGQSLWSWVSVNIALCLWLNFYLVFNRENKFALWGTAVGVLLNSLVIFSVCYFRYFVV